MEQQPLDFIPMWGVFALTIGFVFLLVEAGFLLGAARRKRSEDVKDASVGQMVGATLGLLAFMLAFTFGMAATRYDNRRALVMEEANAIQDAYLRADLLPQQHRAEIRSLLRQYVEIRTSWSGAEQVHEAIAKSEAVQQRLWSHAVALGQEHPNSVVVALFITSVNEVVDLHTKRV